MVVENEIRNKQNLNLFKGMTGKKKVYKKSNTNGNQEF